MAKKITKIICLLLFPIAFWGFLSFPSIFAEDVPAIPEEVVRLVPEKDLIEVFCLMTKWKSGDFFASLESLEEVLVPALEELKGLGIETDVPDFLAYSSAGKQKLEAVCASGTYAGARVALSDFISYAEGARSELGGLNGSLAAKLKGKGDELRSKAEKEIKSSIDDWVEQEKPKIEAEIKAEADKMAEEEKEKLIAEVSAKNFKSESEAMAYAMSRAEQIKSGIDSRLSVIAEQKKKDLEDRAEAKVSEFLGVDAKKFKEAGVKFQGIEGEINHLIQEKRKEYDVYKVEAMKKRKALILAVLKSNIDGAAAIIKEKEGLLGEAKLNDPSVKTAGEYIKDLESDADILAGQIQKAIDSGDEEAIGLKVSELKNKWEGINQNLEKDLSKRRSKEQICSEVVPQVLSAKSQIEAGLDQINAGQEEILQKKEECDFDKAPLCSSVDDVFAALLSAEEKADTFLTAIEAIKEKCSLAGTRTDEILELAIPLKEQGLSYKEEMSSLKKVWQENKLKLEKALLEKPETKDICRTVFPELSSYQKTIDDDLISIASIKDNCSNNNSLKCKTINENIDKFNSVRDSGQSIFEKINSTNKKCKTKIELKELIVLLNEIGSDYKEFIITVDKLKAIDKIEAETSILIEAESETGKYLYPFDVSWHSTKEIGTPPSRVAAGQSGGDWYLSRGGESLSYNFTLQKSGDYIIWVKDFSDDLHSVGARAIEISIDGKSFGVFNENNARAHYEAPAYGIFAWQKAVTVSLLPGKHTLTVKKAETTSAAAILDAFFITNNPLAVPEI